MNKKRVSNLFLAMILVLALSGFVLAASISEDLHLNIQTTNATGGIVTGTFNFVFNISNSSDCNVSNVVYSNSTSLTTDTRGIISYYLPKVNLTYDIQYYLCYYRDGDLQDSSQIVRTPYTFRARNITLSGVEIDQDLDMGAYNITTTGTGFFEWLGSLANKISKLFVIDIDFNGTINGTGNITTTGNITAEYIGVGTTTPSQRLDVAGGIQIGDASLAEAGVIRWTGSEFQAYNGTHWNAFGSGGAGSLWSQDGSDIYFNTGNVGIGTATPQNPLNVVGEVNITENLTVGGNVTFAGSILSGSGATSGAILNEDTSNTNPTLVPSRYEDTYGLGYSPYSLHLIAGSTNVVEITSSQVNFTENVSFGGNMTLEGMIFAGTDDYSGAVLNKHTSASIPTLVPSKSDLGYGIGYGSQSLHLIAGNTNVVEVTSTNVSFNKNVSVNGNVTADYFFGDGSQLTGITGSQINNNLNWLNATSANDTYVPYTGSNQNVVLGDYNFSVGGTDFFVNSNTGNVGIGTTTPQNTLNVIGDGNFTGNLTANWFNGLFNWTTDSWSSFNGYNLTFNESKLSTIYYNATQSEFITGTLDGGTLVDTQHSDGRYDGVTLNFSEASGSPALDVRVNFTSIEDFNRGVIRYKTSSLAGAYPIIQMWNYDMGVWEDYPPIAESKSFATITQPVFDASDHVQDNVAQMRIYKASNGNTNNHYYVDWLSVAKGYGTPSGEEIDPYSFHKNENINNTGYNITASNFFGTFSGNSSIWSRAGTNTFLTNVGDNVGIGTASPNAKLDVATGNVSFDIGNENRFVISDDATDTNANSPKLSFFARDYSGGLITGPSIQKIGVGGTYGRGRLAFFQHAGPDYTSENEVMSILYDGKVGIGTTSPTSPLYVNASAYNGPAMIVDRYGAGGVASIQAGPSNTWLMLEGASTTGNVGVNYYSSGDVILAYGGGAVGIGTATPQNPLNVVGDGNFTGDLTVSGDDLYMATNIANYFLMADGTNYNPTTPANARTGLGLTAGGAGDIWVEKGGDTMTGTLNIEESTIGATIASFRGQDTASITNVLNLMPAKENGYGTDQYNLAFEQETGGARILYFGASTGSLGIDVQGAGSFGGALTSATINTGLGATEIGACTSAQVHKGTGLCEAESSLSVSYATTAGGAPPTGTASGDLSGSYPSPAVLDDSHNHIYSNIDPFTEANLYTILSDVTQFYEAGDKVGDADTLDTLDSTAFPQIQSSSFVPGSTGWWQIAYTNGGDHGMAYITVYDRISGTHSAAKFLVTNHHGQSTITQIAGDTYSGSSFTSVRTMYLTADRVYGGAVFEINVASTAGTIYYDIQEINIANHYNEWAPITPVVTSATWTADKTLSSVTTTGLATTSNARIGGSLTVSGAITGATINTGAGAKEIGDTVGNCLSTDVHKGDGGCEAESSLSVGFASSANSATSADTANYATSAGNADTVDSLHAADFLRSNADDTWSGILTAADNGGDIQFGDATSRLRMYSDGSYFKFDKNAATAGLPFYVTSDIPVTYLYSATTYLGGANGDDIRVRDNELYGDDWTINYNEAGNWGIGTTGPLSKLSVGGVGNANWGIYGSGATVGVYGGSVDTGVYGYGTMYGVQASGGTYDFFAWDSGGKSYFAGDVRIGTTIIDKTGKVGIGDLTPDAELDVVGAGIFSSSVTASAFYYGSDESLKTNITLMNNSLDRIKQLEGINFNWKENGERSMGLIAQDVEKVYPELVGSNIMFNETTNETKIYKTVQYGNLVAPLIESVKELDKQDEKLNNKSEEQGKEIEELRNEVELLRAEISALSSGNLGVNITLENINTNSILENKDADLIFENEESNPPLKNKSFFSKYFYTLFNNKF